MEFTAVQGSGVRQENSRAIVTQNRYKKELADMSPPSSLINCGCMGSNKGIDYKK